MLYGTFPVVLTKLSPLTATGTPDTVMFILLKLALMVWAKTPAVATESAKTRTKAVVYMRFMVFSFNNRVNLQPILY